MTEARNKRDETLQKTQHTCSCPDIIHCSTHMVTKSSNRQLYLPGQATDLTALVYNCTVYTLSHASNTSK